MNCKCNKKSVGYCVTGSSKFYTTATINNIPFEINFVFSNIDEPEFINDSGLEFKDISSEEFRVYHFPDMVIRIDKPLKINVKNGGHRIFDANGVSTYIPTGWRKLEWTTKKGKPNFKF